MIQRVATGSSRVGRSVRTGTPIKARNTVIAVALRSACFHAFGTSGAAATKSMISNSAATRRGPAKLLASGMKISAEPNPENPRAVPDTKAITQMAMAALMLTSVGMRPKRVMLLTEAGRVPKTTSRFSASRPQRPAGLLRHLGHDLGGDRLDLLVGQGFLARLYRHGNRDGLLALIDALAFVDVEHRAIRDQLPVGALRRANAVAGLCAAIAHALET